MIFVVTTVARSRVIYTCRRRCAEPPWSARFRVFVSTITHYHHFRCTFLLTNLGLSYPIRATYDGEWPRARNVAVQIYRRLISLYEDAYAIALADLIV